MGEKLDGSIEIFLWFLVPANWVNVFSVFPFSTFSCRVLEDACGHLDILCEQLLINRGVDVGRDDYQHHITSSYQHIIAKTLREFCPFR